jgi:2-oxoglutarate dehydrogenase E1 component
MLPACALPSPISVVVQSAVVFSSCTTPAFLRPPPLLQVWAQEEPKNMGAWSYVKPRLGTALRELPHEPSYTDSAGGSSSSSGTGSGEPPPQPPNLTYVGRPPAASPATASFAIHQRETLEIIEAALTGPLH